MWRGKIMKQMQYIFRVLLVVVMMLTLSAAPVMSAPAKKAQTENKAKQLTPAQKKKAKAAAKKAKAKAKAAKQKQKAAAKKAKDKAKAAAQKEKEAAKRAEAKEKAAEQKEKEQAKKAKMTPEERRAFNQDLHFVDFWGGAGYSGMVNNYKNTSLNLGTAYTGDFESRFIGGGGGLIGVGYELHHRHFMMKVGPEFRLFSSQDNLNFAEPYNIQQQDYTSMIQHYQFDRLHETQMVGQIMLPVMFGGNFDRYYFLVGAKAGYTVLGSWHHSGKLTTSVTEEMGIEDWTDIPSHYLVREAKVAEHPLYDGTAKGKNPFGLDVTLSAEFGINLEEFLPADWQQANEESKHPWHFRLGAFIDYGMPIISVSQNAPFFTTHSADFRQQSVWNEPTMVTTNSIHQSPVDKTRLNSLLVGIKFTAMLQMNKPKMPNPRMQMWVEDAFTNKGIASASIYVQQEGKVRPQMRTAKKDGGLQQRYPKGNYQLWASATGYLPGDTVNYALDEDLRDTVRMSLIPTPKWEGYVHDSKSEKLITTTLAIRDRETGDTLELMTTPDAPARYSFDYGHAYDMTISAEGYHDKTVMVSDLYATEHFYVDPIIRVRRVLILKHMYFATDKTDILPTSESDLMKLYNFLTENPKIRVMITGHTDSQGSDAYNQRLSEGRSASVKAEMVKRGIDADRLETDGKGESEPIDTNDTEEGRQNNRRVEVTVLNADEAVEDVY